MSQERKSRFVTAWAVAATEYHAARKVVPQTRKRTLGQRGIRWISDGHHVYHECVRETYRAAVRTGARGRPRLVPTPGVALTQMLKRRVERRVVEVRMVHRFGKIPEQPHTVHVERLNGVLRDRLNCLTRQTHGFAKQLPTWAALVGMCLFEHNWLKPHHALRQKVERLSDGRRYHQRSPAMAQGLTDHIWRWGSFLSSRVSQCI